MMVRRSLGADRAIVGEELPHMSYDLVTIGEAMLRFSVPSGARLEDAPSLEVAVAGAEANVAVAVARMGHAASWISRLPTSPLGRRVARELRGHGVDVSHVRWVSGARLGTYYIEQGAQPRPARILYDRGGSAASEMSVEDISWKIVESAQVLHLTGITPALSPSCEKLVLDAAARARGAGTLVCVDVNYRSALWDAGTARGVLTGLCRSADAVVIAERDARGVFGFEGEPEEVARTAQEEFACRDVVLTRGSRGSVWRSGDDAGSIDAHPARVVDRIGVGDAFTAGVIIGLLRDDLRLGVRYGTAMAALKLGWSGDQFWGDLEEVERLLEHGEEDVRR